MWLAKSLPYIDKVQYSIVADQNAELAQFLAGNTDIYQPTTRDRVSQMVPMPKKRASWMCNCW